MTKQITELGKGGGKYLNKDKPIVYLMQAYLNSPWKKLKQKNPLLEEKAI